MALYIVSTPIGNLEDLTQRALRILREVKVIVSEAPAETLKLLNYYQIKTPLRGYFDDWGGRKYQQASGFLQDGLDLALVCKAGTPLLSDPGLFLVREALNRKIPVIPVPGPSALLSGLVSSGFPADSFVFGGFFSKKTGKIKKELLLFDQLKKTMVFYESPYRLKRTLEVVKQTLGDRPVAVGRELTKKFEQFYRGTVSEVLASLPDRIKGEVVLIIGNIK